MLTAEDTLRALRRLRVDYSAEGMSVRTVLQGARIELASRTTADPFRAVAIAVEHLRERADYYAVQRTTFSNPIRRALRGCKPRNR